MKKGVYECLKTKDRVILLDEVKGESFNGPIVVYMSLSELGPHRWTSTPAFQDAFKFLWE